MNDTFKSYYKFKGSWFEIYEKLIEFVRPQKNLRFSIWQSRTAKHDHVLVVYGLSLPGKLMMDYSLVEIDHEDVSGFVNHPELYRIRGFNEFKTQKSNINTYRFFVPRAL
jgi:hypothetical protein